MSSFEIYHQALNSKKNKQTGVKRPVCYLIVRFSKDNRKYEA